MSSSSFSQASWSADAKEFEEVSSSKRKRVAFKLVTTTAPKQSATTAKSKTDSKIQKAKSTHDRPPSLQQKKTESNLTLKKKMENNIEDRLKSNSDINSIKQRASNLSQEAMTQRFRFLNEGIIAQCRKWERLQARAEALEKHKKTLSELRWKMALSGNSKKTAANKVKSL